MRRRSGLLVSMAVVLLALMLPATTAAASPYRVSVLRNTCTLDGGAYGYGKAVMKLFIEERGVSGTNYFKLRTRLQQRVGGTWYTVDQATDVSESFPNDADSWNWTVRRVGHFDANSQTYYHRLVMRVQFMDMRPGADAVLKTRTVYGVAC